MSSSKSSSICSPIRFILCGLITVLFYVAILTYYMHLNFTSFDFHPHIKHGATSTNDDGDTSANHPTLEKPPPRIPRKKKSTNSPTSTTAATAKATPTPTTAKQHHRKHKLKHNGYTVGDSDHHAHGHPGGTEEEANQDRRRLEKHNYDSYKDKSFWNMWWRVADFGDQNSNKNRQHLPESLLETQEHIDDDVELYSLLPYQRKAIEDCNDPQLNNFACLIASYDRQMQSNRHHQTSPKCRSIYGAGLIERLQKNRHVMCEPSSLASSSSSELTCFNDRIHSDHNIDTAVCGGSNLVVNYNRMLDGDFPWLQFETGALSLSKCKVPPIVRQRHWHFMHCLRDWMDLGFQSSSSNSQTSSACEKEQEEEKERHQQIEEDTFFVTRSGDYSPFALAHDWVNTVIVYAVGNISRSNVQINIMDRMTVGFYSPMWSLAFSPGKPVSWFPDLRRKYNQRSAPNGVCYGKSSSSSSAISSGRNQKHNRAWFNIPARLSPLYNNDDCDASPILRFTSDLLVSSVGASAVQSPSNVFVITVIVRRNYQTGHSIERRIPNWKELVDEMRKPSNKNKFLGVDDEEQDSEDDNNNKQKLIVHAIDYADFDFDQQLNISRSTDLLIGMHGAGLIQSMFLPSYGGLFEFFCPDRPPSNNRYENLARRLGISYSSYDIQDSQNRVPVQKVIEEIRRLSKKVYHAKKERV